jgi:hypothetical protein
VSSPLAIAVVSAVIMDLLNDGLIDHDLSAVGSVKVSAKPPDRVFSGTEEGNQLNLFLYQVAPNPGWRNTALPSHDARNGRLTNPPLALDLHYLLTAYGKDDLNAEILLGYAMELLHDLRVIPRDAIRNALANNPLPPSLIPADGQGRSAADLADQVELIKITPHYLAADDLAKLWSAMQSRYRPSMGYQASVVVIQGRKPTRSPLPVLTRGAQDAGPVAHGNLLPPFATITGAAVVDAGSRGRPAAELGDTIALRGFNLAGTLATALFTHRSLETPIERPALLAAGGTEATVLLPAASAADAAEWRAGTYGVALRLVNGTRVTLTNQVPLAVAPRIVSALPLAVVRNAAGEAQVTVTTAPRVHPGQQASLIVGGDEYVMPPVAAATDTVAITIADAEPVPDPLPLRLRIDGLDTLVIPDITATPPTFDPKQSITIT